MYINSTWMMAQVVTNAIVTSTSTSHGKGSGKVSLLQSLRSLTMEFQLTCCEGRPVLASARTHDCPGDPVLRQQLDPNVVVRLEQELWNRPVHVRQIQRSHYCRFRAHAVSYTMLPKTDEIYQLTSQQI